MLVAVVRHLHLNKPAASEDYETNCDECFADPGMPFLNESKKLEL